LGINSDAVPFGAASGWDGVNQHPTTHFVARRYVLNLEIRCEMAGNRLSG